MSNNMYFQEGERLTETHGRMDSIGASQMDQVSKDVSHSLFFLVFG